MNRATLVKTGIAFLAGVACTLTGVQIWLNQPAMAAFNFFRDPQHSMSETALVINEPALMTSESRTEIPAWYPYDTFINLVPLNPALKLKPEDFAGACVNYENDEPGLIIGLTPTAEAGLTIREALGKYVGDDGRSPLFSYMAQPGIPLFTFKTTRSMLSDYDDQLAQSRGEFDRLMLDRLVLNVRPAYVAEMMDLVAVISGHTAVELCPMGHGDTKSVHEALSYYLTESQMATLSLALDRVQLDIPGPKLQ